MKREDLYKDPFVGPAHPQWWFVMFCRIVFPIIFGIPFRPRVEGRENMPKTGGAILCGNHTSYLDPVFPWYLLGRKIRYMGKIELFETPVVGWASTAAYAFPVRRGSADREAIKLAVSSLKRGDIVGIFPEGQRVRGDDMEVTIHGGPALIAQMAGVKIIPIGLEGVSRIFPKGAKSARFPKVILRVGEAVDPADFADVPKGERSDAIMNEVMRRVYALRDGRM